MYTDVLGGVQLGYRTVLVLSGHTAEEDLKDYAYQPDIVANSLSDVSIDWLFRREHANGSQPVLAR